MGGKGLSNDVFDLTGKTAFITGGGTGLGFHMARALASSRAKIVIAARRILVLEQAASALIREAPTAQVLCQPLDLSDQSSIDKAAESVMSQMGGIDIFVGNAGLEYCQPLEKNDEAEVASMLQVNVGANISLVKHFLPNMQKNKWGRVLFSSSVSSVRGVPQEGLSVYSAAKGALNAFTRTAAAEAGRNNVTFNCLNFGMFHTDMLDSLLADIDSKYGEGAGAAYINDFVTNVALGRLGKCEEIESMIKLLASDAGGYITGADIPLDGGLSIMLRANPLEN